MPDLVQIIQAGSANPWIYLPAAVLLGALHALEPGHSKSLMAAFIIAIRGTIWQAVLLGIAAAVGHTLVVWVIAIIGLSLGDALILDKAEPWLVLVSGLLIMVLAARLVWQIMSQNRAHDHHHHDDHDHADHDHASHPHHHAHPHHHGHDHAVAREGDEGELDAHAAAHAREIESRFAGRSHVSNGEILWFGFTGGLLPCPAAIAVLLICLQLKALTLGIAMVAAFSLGLAITLVTIGVAAAWGARKAAARWSGFSRWADRLPYASAGLVFILGIGVTARGIWMLGIF